MLESVLNDVKAAEKEAESTVNDAKQKASSIVSDARAKAAQVLKESEANAAKRREQAEERQAEKLQAIREKVLADGADEIKSLKKSAARKSENAVEIALEAFEKEISR